MAEDGERRKQKPLTFAGKYIHFISPRMIRSINNICHSLYWNRFICYNFCVGLTALAQALDSKQAHTSFGKLPLSTEKTAAAY